MADTEEVVKGLSIFKRRIDNLEVNVVYCSSILYVVNKSGFYTDIVLSFLVEAEVRFLTEQVDNLTEEVDNLNGQVDTLQKVCFD